MYGFFTQKVNKKEKKKKRRRTIYQIRLTVVITLFFTTMSKLRAEFNFYLMWLNFVQLIGQYAHWIFMRFFEVFNHSLQLQLTRTHTSETVVAKVVLKMNFPSYFLLTLAGIHRGKRTNGYYMNLYLAQFLLFGWGLGLLSLGVMFTRLTWL